MDVYFQPVKSEPVPVSIVGGYLGSGKTTLINHLLRSGTNRKLAFLVNDFGELPIDASLIESKQGNVINLSGGCVCCSYGDSLSMALLDITSMQDLPEQIIIEASGVALPDAIAQSLSLFSAMRLHAILVVVDIETIEANVHDKYVGDTFVRQIKSADILVVNKCDLVDQSTVQSTEPWLDDHYPDKHKVFVEHSRIPLPLVLDTSLQRNDWRTASITRKNSHFGFKQTPSVQHSMVFRSFTLTVKSQINIENLVQMLTDKSLGLLRVKGYLETRTGEFILLQLVGSRVHLSAVQERPSAALTGKLACITLAQSNAEHYLNGILKN
jgi:G3E family GTPase